jgi:uncharacterized protein YndB with AHSA1/START domain
METISIQRSETRTVSIAAPPRAVLDVVGDPRRFPDWAPAFARSVRPEGDDWLVNSGAGERRIRVVVAPDQGTVDLLDAGRPTRGAFLRVLPNGEGSELVFTLFFPDGTAEQAVIQQMAVVEDELRAVRSLCLSGG